MKKISLSIILMTILSVMYVHQQTRLLECSYEIYSSNKDFAFLIDRNNELRYNVAKLERPARLETIMLAKNEDVFMPRTLYRLELIDDMPPVNTRTKVSGPIGAAGKMIMSMFLLDNEAVANELLD
ncbi:MAG: hypothetical protein ABIB11_02335 [Candidatus Omnitrophota bacterium]